MGVEQLSQALEHPMCTPVCASGCCPGQVPVCLCSSRADVSSPIPYREMQLLAPLCSAARNSLSPDKNYIARLLFHKQLPCIKGCLPHTAGAEHGDPTRTRAEPGRGSASPDCPHIICLISTAGLLGKCRKGKQRLPTSTKG